MSQLQPSHDDDDDDIDIAMPSKSPLAQALPPTTSTMSSIKPTTSMPSSNSNFTSTKLRTTLTNRSNKKYSKETDRNNSNGNDDDDSSTDDDEDELLNFIAFPISSSSKSSSSSSSSKSSSTTKVEAKKQQEHNITPVSPASSSSETFTQEEIERRAKRIAEASYIPITIESPSQLCWLYKTKKKTNKSSSRKRRQTIITKTIPTPAITTSPNSTKNNKFSKYDFYPCRTCQPDEIVGLALKQNYDKSKQIPIEYIEFKDGCSRFKDKSIVNKSMIIPFHGGSFLDDGRGDDNQEEEEQQQQHQTELGWNQDILKHFVHQERHVKSNRRNRKKEGIEDNSKLVENRALELFLKRILDFAIDKERGKKMDDDDENGGILNPNLDDKDTPANELCTTRSPETFAKKHNMKSKSAQTSAEKEWRLSQIKVGSTISVYWHGDGKYYKVKLSKPTQKKRTPKKNQNGLPSSSRQHMYTLTYDSGESEEVDLSNIPFEILDEIGNIVTYESMLQTSDSHVDNIIISTIAKSPASKSPSPVTVKKPCRKETLLSKIKIGSSVEVLGSKDKMYHKATIGKATKRKKSSSHVYTLHFEDGGVEDNVDLAEKEFKINYDKDEIIGSTSTTYAVSEQHNGPMVISQEIEYGETIVHDHTDEDDENGNADSDSSDHDSYVHKSEPIRALDVIEYYPPTAIFGDSRNLKVAQILSCQPRGEPVLTLNNGDYLETDTKVKRIMRILRGKLVDHNGSYKAIKAYKLRTGKAPIDGKISGVQMKSKELTEILRKSKEQLIEQVKSSGLGDCSDFLHNVGKS